MSCRSTGDQPGAIVFNGESMQGLDIDLVPSRILRGVLERAARKGGELGNNHSSYGMYATWSRTMAPIKE